MKNVEVLYTPEEIKTRVSSMWKTDLFRKEAANPDSFIHKVVERAAAYPLFLMEASDHPSKDTPDPDKTEWPHFTAWFGGIPKREYENPAINDLSLLHELYHKGFMQHVPGMDFESFRRKIFDNELEASVTSELQVYFTHPEFRQLAFKQEIFADRFLKDEKFMKRWQQEPVAAREWIREKRRDVMNHPHPKDAVEGWIRNFALGNDLWAYCWKDEYPKIEEKMFELQQSIRDGADRKEAMDKFMSWLQSPEITKGTEISFPDVAVKFHGFYSDIKKGYAQSVRNGDMQKGKVSGIISSHYPGDNPEEALEKMISAVHGDLPHYSNRKDHQVTGVTTTAPGSFVVMYALPPTPTLAKKSFNVEDTRIVILQRGEKGQNGEARYGMCGGYTNLDFLSKNGKVDMSKGEQPSDGAAREITEELRDPGIYDKQGAHVPQESIKAQPIITPDASRLHLVSAGIDYKKRHAAEEQKKIAEDKRLDVSYVGYQLELNPQELAAVQKHASLMETDGEYKKCATSASDKEVTGVKVMTLKEALKLKSEQFTYPHEFKAMQDVCHQLTAQFKSSRSIS